MVVGQGMCLALVGVVIGIVSALGLSRLLATFLFGVKPRDLAVFIAVPLVLTLVSLVAVWLPARRAAHVDPATALRSE
jgi:ABC-type antimicrobial peptide transport system permease subunit